MIGIIYYEKCGFHCECVDDCGMFSQSEMPLFMGTAISIISNIRLIRKSLLAYRMIWSSTVPVAYQQATAYQQSEHQLRGNSLASSTCIDEKLRQIEVEIGLLVISTVGMFYSIREN